jgi:hypothetical protein
MKIADFSLAMKSDHTRTQQSSSQRTLAVQVNPSASANLPQVLADTVTLSAYGQEKLASETASTGDVSAEAQNDPKLQLIIDLVERLTGKKVRLFDPSEMNTTGSAGTRRPSHHSHSQANQPSAGFSADFTQVNHYSEAERTTFQAAGVIKTQDGKTIQFNLALAMQHQYSETSSTAIHIGDAAKKTDPLVINFNGLAAQLSEQRFAFDLNSDGQAEQINAPTAGSGFLALDLNGDGSINNGSELFGANTGNGFSELAQYDSDHNSWIDENDAVFQQLQVWTKDASGNDQLNSLASMGVGAISLDSIATPFDIKTSANQLLGSVRSSSVSLNENGSVGVVQQIDLTV